MSAAQPLAGRVAIVTGASSGLGARFATVLADAGAQVVAAARRLDRLEELARANPAIHPVRSDVAEDGDRAELVAKTPRPLRPHRRVREQRGHLLGRPERQATVEAFREVMRVNVEAVFALSHAVAEPMRAQGSGSVINISSMFSLVAAGPGPEAGYVASKSALNGLTRELASQWARHGIRVNAVAPGWFPSEMTRRSSRTSAGGGGSSASARWGAPGRIDELDGVLLFLASDASSYCTGQVITIDGGWTIR